VHALVYHCTGRENCNICYTDSLISAYLANSIQLSCILSIGVILIVNTPGSLTTELIYFIFLH
jgi:hypothetical protein